jgi:hypothetical protein
MRFQFDVTGTYELGRELERVKPNGDISTTASCELEYNSSQNS